MINKAKTGVIKDKKQTVKMLVNLSNFAIIIIIWLFEWTLRFQWVPSMRVNLLVVLIKPKLHRKKVELAGQHCLEFVVKILSTALVTAIPNKGYK